jgi:hypothetical protein
VSFKDMGEEMLAAAKAADEAAASRPLGEQIRLLQCWDCKTMEEFDDYEGNPKDDVTLHYIDEKHGGHTQMPHNRTLHSVGKEQWANPAIKRQSVKQMWETETGFKPSYYDIKNTLQEDAVKCHIAHQRQVPCIDWKDSSKKLTAPTTKERKKFVKELPRSFGGDRDAIAKGAPVQYLCEWCPVAVAVDYAKRKARGEE